jgi:hypothetical protein
MQSKWLFGFALGSVLTACSSTESIGSGSEPMGGTGGGAAERAGTTGGDAAGVGRSEETGGNSAGGSSPSGSSGTTPAPVAASGCTTEIVATEGTSYGVKGEGAFEIDYVKPSSELTFDWSALAHNLAGEPLDPQADIDELLVGLARLSVSELIQHFTDGNLAQSDLDVVLELPTEEARTTASTFDLNPVGGSTRLSPEALLTYFDANQYPPATHTYFAMVSHGTDVGFGVQAYTLFSLDPTTAVTTVPILDPKGSLAVYTSPPDTPNPVVPVGVAGIDIDFSQLTHDTRGRAISSQDITKVEVIMTSTPLVGTNLNSLFSATRDHVWHRSLSNESTVNLATLTDDEGMPFGGFERGYGWLLELHDDGLVPLLAYLAVLSPGCDP